MRPQDKTVFLEAARFFQSWILVRRTNPASLQYIGMDGYTPKPIDCKAKTADIPHKLAGLVVDPRIHPKAFKPHRQSSAEEAWRSMQPLLGKKYIVNEDKKSPHYGCVLLNGCCIHGDYDLYDVIDVTEPRRNLGLVTTLEGQKHVRAARFYEVQSFICSRIGSEMVKHGGEAQYADHTDQILDVFEPGGAQWELSNKAEIVTWYQNIGRRTLAEEPWFRRTDPNPFPDIGPGGRRRVP